MRNVIAFRHAHPVVRQSRFLHAHIRPRDGLKDVTWVAPSGQEKETHHWVDPERRCLGVVLRGAAEALAAEALDETVMLIVNAAGEPTGFVMPVGGESGRWRLELDTSRADGTRDDPPLFAPGETVPVPAHSILVFVEALGGGGPEEGAAP